MRKIAPIEELDNDDDDFKSAEEEKDDSGGANPSISNPSKRESLDLSEVSGESSFMSSARARIVNGKIIIAED